MFRHAPSFEERLLAQAQTLAADRAQLEQKLAVIAGQEEDVRGAWRALGAAVPGQNGDLDFPDGATVPNCRPTEAHPGISNYVAQDDWPSWFHDTVRAAERLYAARRPEEMTA